MRRLPAACAVFLGLMGALSGPLRAETPALPQGLFRLVALNGAPFTALATLETGMEGRVAGSGPCNRWSVRGPGQGGLLFGPVLSTRRACPDLVAEQAFFAALGAVDGADWNVASGALTLTGRAEPVLLFERQEE